MYACKIQLNLKNFCKSYSGKGDALEFCPGHYTPVERPPGDSYCSRTRPGHVMFMNCLVGHIFCLQIRLEKIQAENFVSNIHCNNIFLVPCHF